MDTQIYRILAIDSDPFRNGNDCCQIIHTNAGRCKQILNEANAIINGWFSDSELSQLLDDLGLCTRNILTEGYRLAQIGAKLHVMGMVP